MRIAPIWALLLASCTSVAGIHDDYLRERAKLDPQWATGIGIHDHDDQVTRHDDATVAARRALVRRTLEKLKAYRPDRDEEIDHHLFSSQLEVTLYDLEREDYRKTYLDAPVDAVSAANDLLLKDFAPLEVRRSNAAARLRAIPDVVRDAMQSVGSPPRIWTEMAISVLEDTIPAMDGFGMPEAAAAKKALEEYRAFLQAKVLPRSDGKFAAGKEAYNYYLRKGLLVPMDAPELLAIGRREFEATLRMLEDVAKELDPSKTWQQILEEMKKDYPKLDEVLDVYRREVARARQFMIDRNVVGIPEWEKLEVIPTPPYEASSTPTAAYHAPGPLDAARTGHFYVTLPDRDDEGALAAHNIYDIPGTVWHEAYPGHHLQFVYAKEVTSKIRRLNDAAVLSEGWGFYCEELAHELGYYTNRKERLMQLNWRLLRAARVICDVSLHTGEMTYEDAVRFLMEQVGMNRNQAEPSVFNFTQSPTYYSSYMLGMLEIVRMREKFRSKLGARFTLREFHERLLRFGNVPPSIIEAELDKEWK